MSVEPSSSLGYKLPPCPRVPGIIVILKQLFNRSRLPRAIQQGNLKLLLKAIHAKEDLNCPIQIPSDPEATRTAVEHALRLGHTDCLQKLLEAGADLPERDAQQRLLLCTAIGTNANALNLTTSLLQAGANANADNGEALFACLAIEDDNLALMLINRLVEYGVNLNAFERDGKGLLGQLMTQERTMLVGTLISAGAALPQDLEQLDCSDEIKQFAQRKAHDIAIQHQLLGLP
ncbi:MAG: hypothetical protein V7752_16220 [Halopseudomonas sp.]